MFDISSHELVHLLATYGYWAVLVFVAVESAGIPVPGETMLLVASVYAGTTHHLHGALVVLAAVTGAVVGDNLGFVFGLLGGSRLLQRYGKYIRVDQRKLQLGQFVFRRYGGRVVFLGRFVPMLRIWAAFLAGANRMSWKRFLVCNAGGGLVWASLYGVGGYVLGNSMIRLGGPVALASLGLATAVTIVVGVMMRRKEHELVAEAEREGYLSLAA